MKTKKPYSNLQKILWLIAGSEISALEKCPNEYNRHANIGLMIFITSLFAALTSYIAGNTFVKESTLGVLIFAFIWALLIFSLDRSMVNSIKKGPEASEKFLWGYFWPRLVLAIILSFFMSIPLDHIVFKERILYQMEKNANTEWLIRKSELRNAYTISGDSAKIVSYEGKAQELDSQFNEECAKGPNQDYNIYFNEAGRITVQEIPKLLNEKHQAANDFNQYFQYVRESQSPSPDSLIKSKDVKWDANLVNLSNLMASSKNQYFNRLADVRGLYQKADSICRSWKNDIMKQKEESDSLKNNTKIRLEANTALIDTSTTAFKKMLDEMRGFDTQFTTLFLMPNWGVQILKWLIFLALLVIEILPTYLKLRTPFGQYDWEMHNRDAETEMESKSKIAGLAISLKDIEDYRVKKEIELNKKVIDRLVVIEEKLANEMLDNWEVKARKQMDEDVDNSL